jgi:hypothetical protein
LAPHPFAFFLAMRREKPRGNGRSASGHGFTGCAKTLMEQHEVSGHDFSRAANISKILPGFSP